MCIPIPFQAPLKSQWRNKNEIWTHINKENESRDHSRWAISTKCWKMTSKRTSSERVALLRGDSSKPSQGESPQEHNLKPQHSSCCRSLEGIKYWRCASERRGASQQRNWVEIYIRKRYMLQITFQFHIPWDYPSHTLVENTSKKNSPGSSKQKFGRFARQSWNWGWHSKLKM